MLPRTVPAGARRGASRTREPPGNQLR
jgi:hypothetical protein